jgi:hypothetical protein
MYSWRRAICLIRLSYFQLNFHYIHQSHTIINHDRTTIIAASRFFVSMNFYASGYYMILQYYKRLWSQPQVYRFLMDNGYVIGNLLRFMIKRRIFLGKTLRRCDRYLYCRQSVFTWPRDTRRARRRVYRHGPKKGIRLTLCQGQPTAVIRSHCYRKAHYESCIYIFYTIPCTASKTTARNSGVEVRI